MASLSEIQSIVQQIHQDLPALIQRARIAPQQVVLVEGLADLSDRLGLVQAGEFRTGNGLEPGFGFSGVRIGYPPFSYNNELWNIVGVENDVLQVGIRSSDGKFLGGGGGATIDSDGVSVLVTSNSSGEAARSYKFVNTGGDIVSWLYDYYPAGDNFLYIQANPISGRNSTVNVIAAAPVGKYAQLTIQAEQSGGGTTNIGVFADADGTTFAELTSDDFFIEADVQVTGGIDVAGALQCDSITNDTGLAAGTYTPTLTNVANITSSSVANPFMYSRVGNIVTGSGRIVATLNGGGDGQIRFTLPIASDLADTDDLQGNATNINVSNQGSVTPDTTNNEAILNIDSSVGVGANGWRIVFQYIVQ